MDLLIDPLLDALAFFLKAIHEIVRAILKKNEEAESKKDEKGQPEKAAE